MTRLEDDGARKADGMVRESGPYRIRPGPKGEGPGPEGDGRGVAARGRCTAADPRSDRTPFARAGGEAGTSPFVARDGRPASPIEKTYRSPSATGWVKTRTTWFVFGLTASCAFKGTSAESKPVGSRPPERGTSMAENRPSEPRSTVSVN